MDYNKYIEMVEALAKPGSEIREQLNAHTAHVLHMAIGVSGEAGELLDAIKKYTIYNKPLDVDNLIEELGDIEFYLQGIRSAFNLSREEVLQRNYAKLSVRYSSGSYSDSQAQERKDKQE